MPSYDQKLAAFTGGKSLIRLPRPIRDREQASRENSHLTSRLENAAIWSYLDRCCYRVTNATVWVPNMV